MKAKAKPFVWEFVDPQSEYSIVFEDDGRVAYAYLRFKKEIVGDAWLYNGSPTPEKPQWDDRTKAPFLNSAEYVIQSDFLPIQNQAEIKVNWSRDEEGAATLFLRGELHARLAPGAKPGWSKLAKKEGPLAKPLR